MANYIACTRTNHFSVTDPDKLKSIVERIKWGEGDLSFFSEENGRFSFGSYGYIIGMYPESEDDTEDTSLVEDISDSVYAALQEIVAPDDAIIITEIGREKLRYLVGSCVVITSNSISGLSLSDLALNEARRLLNNPHYDTQSEY